MKIAQHLLDLSVYVTRKSAPNLVIYSGHDKTVSALLVALSVSDGLWTPYGSRVVIELHASSSRDRPRHFIRVLYNGRDLTGLLPFCRQGNLVGGLLCPLDYLVFDIFRRYSTSETGRSYNQACRGVS